MNRISPRSRADHIPPRGAAARNGIGEDMNGFDRYYELKDRAVAFYDGGWRSADREDLQRQLEHTGDGPVSEEDMDLICAVLEEIDRRVQEMEE